MTQAHAPQIAFLGMGGMAKAITENLVHHGNLQKPLILYNRTKSRAEAHSSSIGHSRVASTIEEAVVDADIVWSCLQNDRAVQATFDDILAINDGIRGKLFVDSLSITPGIANEIAGRTVGAGAEFLAMPVMGEPTMVRDRLVNCIAAGPQQSIERIKPIAQALIELSGESPGTASLLKLMGNVLIMTTMETVAEVNVFAEKCGLGTNNMNKLMTVMFPRHPHAIYNKKMLNGDYYRAEPIVEVHKARSLTAHVLELAQSSGASVPGYEVALRHLETLEAHAGRNVDITGIYGAVRLESGLPFENGVERRSEEPR